MQAFGYYDPTSVQKATQIRRDKSDGKYLAGGQSLLAAMKLRLLAPTDVINLAQIPELRGIRVTPDGAAIQVGAMTTHAEVASSIEIGARIRALAALAGTIGDPQVRNRGTLGGSLAHNDPAADYPAAVLGLGATIATNERSIKADDFFRGLFETALREDELVTAVTFPVPRKAAYVKFRNAASRFALVGVFVADTPSGVRVAVTGAGARGVFRVRAMEQALERSWTAEAIAGIRVPEAELQSDMHAAADYRSHLVTVLAQRAVTAA